MANLLYLVGNRRVRNVLEGCTFVSAATAMLIASTVAQADYKDLVAVKTEGPNDTLPLAAPAPAPTSLDKLKALNHYQEQGTLIKVPGVQDTVLGDYNGFRSSLAEHGFGLVITSLNNFAYDLGSPPSAHPQRYNGQDLTATGLEQVMLTYDLGSSGKDQKQLIGAVVSSLTSWEPLGPRTHASISRLAYYQSFNDKQVEMKVGYLSNALEFIGIYTGGSLAGGTQGPSAIIPFQLGLSRLPMASPGLNLTFNGDNGLYDKVGVQRSISPYGAQEEVETDSHGLRWRTKGGDPLVINELGYKREAKPGSKYIWVRGGFIYNTSDYQKYTGNEESDDNHALFLAGDVQVSTPEGGLPFQGWYVGGTTYQAPGDRNLYDKYFEARTYKIGTFKSRPFDMLSLTVNYNDFSDDARRHYGNLGVETEGLTSSITASYMARLYPGVYLSTGLSRTRNPAFTPKMDDAYNLLVGLNLFF
jgi:porin